MQQRVQSDLRNRLLRQLPQDDLALLARHFEHVSLPKSTVLVEPGEPFTHGYFLEQGIGSVVTTSPEGLEVESGLFGRDGFSTGALAMGADTSPHRIFMQVGGEGVRIDARAFRQIVGARSSVRDLLLLYVQSLSVQTSYTALSNAVHPIDERLARWLLMCHDRIDGDDLPLTHEFIALMLAVRRPSVTTSLHVLEGNRFIIAERGHITIRDRRRLEEFAGDAYGPPEAEYERLIGSLR